jgi:hypothetical protein
MEVDPVGTRYSTGTVDFHDGSLSLVVAQTYPARGRSPARRRRVEGEDVVCTISLSAGTREEFTVL